MLTDIINILQPEYRWFRRFVKTIANPAKGLGAALTRAEVAIRHPRIFATSLLAVASFFGCQTTPDSDPAVLEFSTVLEHDDPVLRATVILAGMGDPGFSFCNGVYVGSGTLLTAAHCLSDKSRFYVMVPTKIRKERGRSVISFEYRSAREVIRHKDFAISFGGVIPNDLGAIRFSEPSQHLMKPIPIAEPKTQLPQVGRVAWVSGEDSYFRVQSGNNLSITSYKMEKDPLEQKLSLIKDASSLIGPIESTRSLLVSINPGTSIHPGVSGSGVFFNGPKGTVLVGIVSRFYLDMNLVAAPALTEYGEWLEKVMAKDPLPLP